ncbi:slit homolog 2 protein isoform X2 [Bactrocera dorsalis]|uniref:Leucine-rich repeat and immunoglobulin-like domain-containing nogo receptor-interacting protein 4 n=1 Tax=Bactrocera dorsalis TaxID=27457 RepID=A0A034VN06_BACDO|nr:slit homolog 2 protein isoform X2 [Bactrocera dorsalis]
MHIYYKFGLFLIFILSISAPFTKAAPSNVSYDNNDDYYEEYYDENGLEQKDNLTVKTTDMESRISTTIRTIIVIPTTKRILVSLNNYTTSSQVLEPKCPKDCHCLDNFKRILCNGLGLTRVPKNLPTTTLFIDLSQNNIGELHIEDFVNISKVREINLSYNQLKFIDKSIFESLINLQRLQLTDNKLRQIEPAAFSGTSNLIDLDLSNNSILLKNDGPFLIRPGLIKFACRNCSWTEFSDDTFSGLASLQSLKLDLNNFYKKINVKAFSPLQNVTRLWLPDLEAESVTELCNLLTAIDNIKFGHFEISCFELVLGTSFNDSIVVTDPPFIQTEIPRVPNEVPQLAVTGGSVQAKETTEEISTKIKYANVTTKIPTTKTKSSNPKEIKIEENKMEGINVHSNFTNSTTASRMEDDINIKKMSVILTGNASTILNNIVNTSVEQNEIKTSVKTNNTVTGHISQDMVNILLICIIIIAIVGIIIGIICRKDVGGIKTKCCRTKKPDQKDQVHPPEEIPLNKLS